MSHDEPVLSVRDLAVSIDGTALLDGVSLDLHKGEILGLVGESGSGKSLLARTIMRILPSRRMQVDHGRILYAGKDLLELPLETMYRYRGSEIGMIFQNPTSHLDPVMSIGAQIVEGIHHHQHVHGRRARRLALDIMERVGFSDPPRQFGAFAHEFSGGMRQRAMIGTALACNPKVMIADEPTTALDVTIQAQILQLLLDIRQKEGLSIILITHDLGVVAQTCDRIAVMHNGHLIETNSKRDILTRPQQAYTRMLIASHPSMSDEAETPPVQRTAADAPSALLQINQLNVVFKGAGGGFLGLGASKVHAVKNVSMRVHAGDTLGIVGESGSGKSTLVRALIGLAPIHSGDVIFDGSSWQSDKHAYFRRIREQVAMVFQDPYNSLNPVLNVHSTLTEVLRSRGLRGRQLIDTRISELLNMVGLDDSFRARKPRQMSGGQCQRVGIARALATEAKVIIADESTAALDVTTQAQILELLKQLQSDIGLTVIFIAHDLAIVKDLCSRVIVMAGGEVVEEGLTASVFTQPQQTYTRDLLSAIPDIDPDKNMFELRA